MIHVYKRTENGLETLEQPVKNAWVNVIDPTPQEIAQLTAWGIPQDFITYSLDVDERPRTEREDDGTLLILLRIPYFQGETTDVPYITMPMGIITTSALIVTICRFENEILLAFSSGKVRGLETGKRNRFILLLLLYTATRFLNLLREINKTVDVVEDRLQASQRNRELLELLKYQKSLVYFTTALKANELVMERLHRWQFFRMYPEDEDLLEDVIIENQQAIEMVNISTNILSSTMDAFASIISNNLNAVMKFLASATIVVNLPSIVFGFFGMNILIPMQSHPLAYLGVLGLAVAISLTVVIWFIRRDWF